METTTTTEILPAVPDAHDAGVRIQSAILSALNRAQSGPEALAVLSTVQNLKSILDDLRRLCEETIIDRINSDGEFMMGDVRWYVGKDKKVKPRNKAEVINAVLDMAGGDVDKLADFLSSDPFKYGAIRAHLESIEKAGLFDELFSTEEVLDLKTGKPKRGLKSIDTKMLK